MRIKDVSVIYPLVKNVACLAFGVKLDRRDNLSIGNIHALQIKRAWFILFPFQIPIFFGIVLKACMNCSLSFRKHDKKMLIIQECTKLSVQVNKSSAQLCSCTFVFVSLWALFYQAFTKLQQKRLHMMFILFDTGRYMFKHIEISAIH